MTEDISKKHQQIFQPIDEKEASTVLNEVILKQIPIQAKSPPEALINLTLVSFNGLEIRVMNSGLSEKSEVTVLIELETTKYFSKGVVKAIKENDHIIKLSKIHKLQRRDTFRVQVPEKGFEANFEISSIGGAPQKFTTRLLDLSVGGAGVEANRDLQSLAKPESEIIGHLNVAEQPPLPVVLQVKYARPLPGKGPKDERWHVGGQFVRINPATSDKIAFFVNEIHRQVFLRSQKK